LVTYEDILDNLKVRFYIEIICSDRDAVTLSNLFRRSVEGWFCLKHFAPSDGIQELSSVNKNENRR